MITAYLTMDDGPTRNTPRLMDYLTAKHITPIFFFEGQTIEQNPSEAIDALKRGAIAGNHSYDHPDMNEISYEECIDQIARTESILEALYDSAGVERRAKLFRFPFGSLGGTPEKEKKLQQYLRDEGFMHLDDRRCTQKWYIDGGQNKNIDTGVTFSFDEWRMANEPDHRLPQLIEHIEDMAPEGGCPLLVDGTHHIIILHDHDFTDDILPDYFRILLDYVQERGVRFVEPEFQSI